ncbi:MAG: C2 family cysteine protease [Candidatus Melainabacteria bacterium]|nr:C2 family cysteine protease [Candidatus Melainabacteria bacterium]
MRDWRSSDSARRETKSGAAAPILIVGTTLLGVALFFSFRSASAADGAPKSQSHTAQSAWGLYGANRFGESADAFETVIKTSAPTARLYYYAALANYKSNRKARARQLCSYVLGHFSGTQESMLCQQLSASDRDKPTATASTSSARASTSSGVPGLLTEDKLPADFWASLTPDVREKLKTPAGKVALKAAVADFNKRAIAAHHKAESSKHVASIRTSPIKDDDEGEGSGGMHKFAADKNLKPGAYPFTSADIAKDGSNGIDQGRNPNCWFEASMASLAELPRGQRLLASMIRSGGPGAYVVRFPGDGFEYRITEHTLRMKQINDKALWASLIECAQVMKFPDNRGAEGEAGDDSRLAVGLGCITGCKAQSLRPGNVDAVELSGFIGGAISSKNPIVCGTWHDTRLMGMESLVVPQHAYTIIGFEPASNLITIRNPHGKHSQSFWMADDPNHHKFEMKENGVFKMHISLFQKYFNEVCRSFI